MEVEKILLYFTSMIHADKIFYKGFTIEPEHDLWALKFGMLYRFYKDEKIYSAISVDACKIEIDELTD